MLPRAGARHILLPIFLAIFTCAPARADDLDTVTKNINRTLLSKSARQSGAAQEALNSMNGDGSWPDQVYTDTDRIHWKCGEHLNRLLDITAAYRADDTPLSAKPEVLSRILKSLNFWIDKDPHNVNWWENEISVPTEIGRILMLLGPDAPQTLRQRGMKLMERAKWEHQAGANLTDETAVQIMRGCLSNSPQLVSQGFSRTWDEVAIVNPNREGIQADHTFHQHGPLLYMSGYGTIFINDVADMMVWAARTSYLPDPAKITILESYVLDGTQWVVRDHAWDFGCLGRGITRNNCLHFGGFLSSPVDILAQYPAPRQREMQTFGQRLDSSGDDAPPPLSGNRPFWTSDFMVQQRPSYYASVRMYSTRTLSTDGFINGEGKKSHHLSDGATCLMISGNEYDNIFPVWDWLKIPGTTVEQNTPLDPKSVNHPGKNKFAGSVSDGKIGCAAMELLTGKLHAEKAWFFFDDQIVCLGAAVQCPTSNPIFTTLNQCLLNGPAGASGAGELHTGERDLQAAHWVWHDSIGYIFPTPTTVHVKIASQSGSWEDIGSGSKDSLSKDVFSLWINHGPHPQNASYAYELLPGSTPQQTMSEAARPSVKIVSNTPQIQAVWNDQLRTLEAAFRQPGSLDEGHLHISVDSACLLILRRTGSGTEICLSNPQGAGGTVHLTVSESLSGKGADKGPNDATVVTVDLPSGPMAGSSVVKEFR